MFGALHFAARSGSGIQFLVIFSLLGINEGLKLVDREFTTKVAGKDGRQSNISDFFCPMAAWLNEVVVRAVALLSALAKEYNMHIIQC